MKIKEGYDGKETTIRISTQSNGSIELWIEQTGLKDEKGLTKETLTYLTPTELYELFREIQIAGRDLFN